MAADGTKAILPAMAWLAHRVRGSRVMTDDATRTLAVGLRDYSTQTDIYWNQIMAASIVVSVPVVAGFLLMQRFLVTGLTAGAVK